MGFQANYDEPKDRYIASEDLNFSGASSPAVVDIESSIGTHSIDGSIYIVSTSGSTGRVLVEISTDGTNYGDQFTLLYNETFSLFGYRAKKVRFTHSGTNSGYRLIAR